MTRGRKSSWEAEQWIGKNKDKEIVVVKFITQKTNTQIKKTGMATTKSSVCLVKFWTYSFGVQSWYWHLVL
jgi:hypothetical protein